EWSQLARRQIDRKAFGHRAEVQLKWAMERDGGVDRVDLDIAITRRHRTHRLNDLAGSVVSVESTLDHRVANRRIESAVGFVRPAEAEANNFERRGVHDDRCPDSLADSPQLAARVEARATVLDVLKPGDRPRGRVRARETA